MTATSPAIDNIAERGEGNAVDATTTQWIGKVKLKYYCGKAKVLIVNMKLLSNLSLNSATSAQPIIQGRNGPYSTRGNSETCQDIDKTDKGHETARVSGAYSTSPITNHIRRRRIDNDRLCIRALDNAVITDKGLDRPMPDHVLGHVTVGTSCLVVIAWELIRVCPAHQAGETQAVSRALLLLLRLHRLTQPSHGSESIPQGPRGACAIPRPVRSVSLLLPPPLALRNLPVTS
jgi:hypothetical protein